MTLAEYLEVSRHEALGWPGGTRTWRILNLLVQGFEVASFGSAARVPLLNCYAVLRDVVPKGADAELQAEAKRYLTEVATALQRLAGEGPT